MAPSSCSNEQSQNVKVFNKATKKTFDDTDKPIARLRDFLTDKNNFSTATIGNISVLFCTQQKPNIKEDTKKNVYLWMTDGTRVSNVGTIVEDIAADSTFDGSVLYTKEELIALHQKYGKGKGEKVANTFSLRRLKDQLENIKYTLSAWKESNETVSELCKKTKTLNIKCTTSPPTYGLVSFLHNTLIEGGDIVWKDKYYFSNVTIAKTKAENLLNGLKFGGKGAGAKWPLRKQNEKPYNFIYFGFTLVATVTITNNTSNNKNSILGIGLTPTTNNNVGLWCKGEKWAVSDGVDSTLKISEKECKHGNTYNVALVLKTQNLNIYINGEKLSTEIKTIESTENIEHFYLGTDNKEGRDTTEESHVTVTNVLLYNCPFEDDELDNLKNYVKSVKVITPPEEAVDTNTTPQEDEQQPTPPPDPIGDENKEDTRSPLASRTEDGGVGGGVRVFSLLLAVLCVSAPLLHL